MSITLGFYGNYTLAQFDETICLFTFSEWLMVKMCIYTTGLLNSIMMALPAFQITL